MLTVHISVSYNCDHASAANVSWNLNTGRYGS